MNQTKKNILIVGQGAKVSALAKKLRNNNSVDNIYAAPGLCIETEYCKNIDIREDDITGLLKFALENNIDLTIPVAEKAIAADIVTFFLTNGQNIFGPALEAANIALNKATGKKLLYKIHAQTSKFGIFDRQQAAEDYLESANFPVTIKCAEQEELDDRLVCTTMSLAKEFLLNLTSKNEQNILIEEFVYGKTFTIYYITDGYTALPVTAAADYKFSQDGNCGILTKGVACYAPDFRISQTIFSRVENIIKNILTSLDRKGSPYLGILGIECTLTGEDKFFVNELKPFLQNHDATAVLNLIDDDLIEIFMSCINGFFSDEYLQIKTNNFSSAAITVSARQHNKVIKGLDNIQEIENIDFSNIKTTNDGKYLTSKGEVFTLTRMAGTLSRALANLYDDLSEINFDGIKFRKDIGKTITIQ